MSERFTKRDWTLFRAKITDWQEAYIDRLNREYIELLNGDGSPADKFWKLNKRIKKDRQRPGVQLEMRRSSFIYNIMSLKNDGVISYEDLSDFSGELKEIVDFLRNRLWNDPDEE